MPDDTKGYHASQHSYAIIPSHTTSGIFSDDLVSLHCLRQVWLGSEGSHAARMCITLSFVPLRHD